MRLFLDRALGELGVFVSNKVNAAQDRTAEHVAALEQHIFERISGFEYARGLRERSNLERVASLEQLATQRDQRIGEQFVALKNGQAQLEARIMRITDIVSRSISDAASLTMGVVPAKDYVADRRSTEAEPLGVVKSAPAPFATMIAFSQAIGHQLDQQERAFDVLQTSVNRAVAEIGKKIHTLGMIVVAVPQEMRARDTRVLSTVNALENDIKNWLDQSDKLQAKLAKTVSAARDESHAGKDELASLLHDAHNIHVEKLDAVGNELRKFRSMSDSPARQTTLELDDTSAISKLDDLSRQIEELRSEIQVLKATQKVDSAGVYVLVLPYSLAYMFPNMQEALYLRWKALYCQR